MKLIFIELYQKNDEHMNCFLALLNVCLIINNCMQILRNLKNAFWPFQHDRSRSLFLRAARAANCIDQLNSGDR